MMTQQLGRRGSLSTSSREKVTRDGWASGVVGGEWGVGSENACYLEHVRERNLWPLVGVGRRYILPDLHGV